MTLWCSSAGSGSYWLWLFKTSGIIYALTIINMPGYFESDVLVKYSYHANIEREFFFTFTGPYIVNVFKRNQKDATLYNDIYNYKCSTCFMRFLRPSSGAQNCTHSIGCLSSFFCFLPLSWVSWNSLTIAVSAIVSDKHPMLCMQFWAPDDGRRNRLKHVEHL